MLVFLLVALGIIFIVLLIGGVLSSSGERRQAGRGEYGEMRVSEVLGNIDGRFSPINNVHIIDRNGRSHQIDHIYVSLAGVFVVETKNISGRVYGSPEAQNWRVYLGSESYIMYNPLKQNDGHKRVIERVIGAGIPIIPLTVFVQNNEPFISSDLIGISELEVTIKSHPEYFQSIDEINSIRSTIFGAISSEFSEEKHEDYVSSLRDAPETGICPLCKGRLVVRKGRYGEFLGCENYPRCHYTHSVE